MPECNAKSDDAIAPAKSRHWSFAERHALFLVGVSPVVANLIGSAFNIYYNVEQIHELLSPAQRDRFAACWQLFNVVIYPFAVACWVVPLLWLRPTHRALLAGEPVDAERLVKSQRCVINLPWWILTVAFFGWLICIPVFPTALKSLPEPLDQNVVLHLVTSFLIGALFAVVPSFFAVEIVSQRTLFPVFFRRENPAEIPGAKPLSITSRGILWTMAAVVSPVVTFVLLFVVRKPDEELPILFVLAVAVVVIAFGLSTSWMLSKLIIEPVHRLLHAATSVSHGNLDVHVDSLKADEFGTLIARFNEMIEGLREREKLQQTFGRHVGREAARQILEQGDGLVGAKRVITVMFVDVRNFTAHSSKHSPEEVVSALNIFFRDAVEKVESHGGMVNKFLGDGFMALFGVGAAADDHAQQAVEAGQAMLCCLHDAREELEQAGWPGLAIGIGVNTGPAIVGSIGSPLRQEYTAIGDTVNVAARVESLTKSLGRCLLVTESTRAELPDETDVEFLGEHEVKGRGLPLAIYAVPEPKQPVREEASARSVERS